MEKKEIESLLIKSFSSRTTPEEELQIRKWTSESETNRKDFDVYRELWRRSDRLLLPGVIDVEPALKKTKRRIADFNKNVRWLRLLRQAAAVLVTSAVLSFLVNYFLRERSSEEAVVYQEIKAAYGTQTKLFLSDGTLVWLNSGSSLKFPVSFGNLDKRNVMLSGEGYFDVVKNEKKPFVVHTPDLNVTVLGTSFDVSAYANEREVTVALLWGKVSLSREVKGQEREITILNPNEVIVYDSQGKNSQKLTGLDNRDMDKYVAWKEGKMVFSDDPIEKLVTRLENRYNVKIEIGDDNLKKYHVTGTFDDVSLDQVLKYLSLSTPLIYKFQGKPGEGGQQKIILFSK